jgi:hypothetical protein
MEIKKASLRQVYKVLGSITFMYDIEYFDVTDGDVSVTVGITNGYAITALNVHADGVVRLTLNQARMLIKEAELFIERGVENTIINDMLSFLQIEKSGKTSKIVLPDHNKARFLELFGKGITPAV